MRKIRGIVYVLAAAVVAGGAWGFLLHSPGVFRKVLVLPEEGILPEFSLTDQHEQPFNLASMAGAVWVVDFIFTRCAGQCPMMTQSMASLREKFENTPGVRFASITVDPDYDNPKRLAAYARQRDIDSNQWLFLTGSEEAVFALSRNGFHLGVAKDGSPKEPVTHSVRLVLVDQRQDIRGYFDATDSADMARLEDAVRALLEQR